MGKLHQVLLIGFIIRVAIPQLLPQIPCILSSTVEISTPINSFKSLQEAFYYLENDINLYDGGINHHPPLVVNLLSLVNGLPMKFREAAFSLIFALVDLVTAFQLISLNKWYSEYNSKRTQKKLVGLDDSLIATFFLLNPLLILTNLSHSTLCFTFLFISTTLTQIVVRKNPYRAMILLSFATYISFSPGFLAVPMLALAHAVSSDRDWKTIYFQGAGIFFASSSLLVLLSYAVTSSFQFIDQCYGTIIKFSKISPNVGLWWYLFTEMFTFFNNFYIGVFNLFSVIFIVPLSLRLFEFSNAASLPIGDSFLAVVLSYFWLSFTKSYPTVGDLGFGLALIPILKPTIIPHCRYYLVSGLILLVCCLLSPIFYYCWIVLGNGNSNFFYSINLFFGIVYGLIMSDLLWACLTKDYILENAIPDNEVAALRITQF